MYSTKVLLPVAAMAGASLAQSFSNTACTASVESLIAAAPTFPAVLESYLSSQTATQPAVTATSTLPPNTLEDPEGYVELICGLAGSLPESLLPDFSSWGSALLSYGSVHITEYNDFVTECITTGPAAATITSYLNSILTGTGHLCEPTTTATPGTGTGTSNGTISATYASTSATATSTTPVMAGASRPTGVLAGAAAVGGILGAVALL